MVEREWFDKDYYKVLGLTSSATEKEITRAYRKLAKSSQFPDTNPGSEETVQEGEFLGRLRRARGQEKTPARSTTRSAGLGPGRVRLRHPAVPVARPGDSTSRPVTSWRPR